MKVRLSPNTATIMLIGGVVVVFVLTLLVIASASPAPAGC